MAAFVTTEANINPMWGLDWPESEEPWAGALGPTEFRCVCGVPAGSGVRDGKLLSSSSTHAIAVQEGALLEEEAVLVDEWRGVGPEEGGGRGVAPDMGRGPL
jgi:hypothetical protein